MTEVNFPLPEGTHTVILGVGDLNGLMRGKRIPADQWPRICGSGNALAMSLFTMDMTCDVWETPVVGFANGFPDCHIFPMHPPVAVPWEPGVAMCFARAEGMDHGPLTVDPRQALLRQVERANAMGIDLQVGTELEFYLLDPDTGRPRDKGNDCYGLARAAELEPVLGPMRRELAEMGIPIEQSNPEYAAGQVEVNIRYDSAMIAADRVVMFRSLVKQLAARHGLNATFMAKPFIDESGNGFHLHYSLWSEGKNIFADAGKLNDLGRHFLGGMQQRMAEASICGAATVNAYRRRQPLSFCPVNASWGLDNRTVALRVIEGSDSAVRIEKRDAGADCNPYLLMAADIAAGLDGIEGKTEPTAITTGNAYEDDNAPTIPLDLADAISLARNSGWLRDVLGADQHEIWLQQAERELAFFNQQVTPFETARYLGTF
ncbi:MAG: glutamine synthetase family protein [Pseudomonadota bacterium]|nr:glutamine synthetase family protein [Pseudomonadota bacterium]MEC7644852.1 glutamine synthetase family protein [Pseudomonadota bacterium]